MTATRRVSSPKRTASALTLPYRRHRELRESEAALGQLADRLDDAGMFDRTADDGAGRCAGEAEDREVIRLGGAAGEEDFVGMGVEEGGDPLAGVFKGLTARADRSDGCWRDCRLDRCR